MQQLFSAYDCGVQIMNLLLLTAQFAGSLLKCLLLFIQFHRL